MAFNRGPARRLCLKCRTYFNSDGPGNRICKKCKKKTTGIASTPNFQQVLLPDTFKALQTKLEEDDATM